MGSPTLMYCIGATKAGTSWLHRFVADHPQCYLRAAKELHYHDSVAFDDWDYWGKEMATQRDRVRASMSDNLDADVMANRTRVAQDLGEWADVLRTGKEDDAAYLEYLQNGRGDARLVGDFTPAYGLLPVDSLRHMAGLLPDVRFVYLMRDPVARIWSHARMMAGRQVEGAEDVPQRAVKLMKRILNGMEPQIVRRSDYIGPVTRLRAAVDPAKIFFGFYEDMFTQGTVAKLCAFLGIDMGTPDFDKRVMQGPSAAMVPGQWNEMRDYLAPQYDAMREIFGTLPDAWGAEPIKV